MRIVVVGCGAMGKGAAYDLATSPEVESLLLVDQDERRAQSLAAWLDKPSVEARTKLELADADAVALAAPWPATRAVVEACVEAGVPVTSITRPPDEDVPWLERVGGRVLLPLGLEPGLTELLARRLAETVDSVEEIHVRCGGIPVRPEPPLAYKAVFGGGSLPIGLKPTHEIANGELRAVERFSGLESMDVAGVGRLEAYHDGLPPWIASDPVIGRARTVTQKTIRWPGFAETVGVLGRLGLLAETPIAVDGAEVVPKRVVEEVLAPHVRLEPGDEDLVVLQATARGRSGETASARALIRSDRETGLTAMARATGFVLGAGARLLARGEVEGTGWLQPQQAISSAQLDDLLRDLRERGLAVELS